MEESPSGVAERSIFFDMHAPPDTSMAVGDPDPDWARPDYVVPYFEGRSRPTTW